MLFFPSHFENTTALKNSVIHHWLCPERSRRGTETRE